MKIRKFNENINTDTLHWASKEPVIEDIVNILQPLVDNGFKLSTLRKDIPETQRIDHDCIFKMWISPPINMMIAGHMTFYLIEDDDTIEKLLHYQKFLKVITDNIEEIKDRLEDMNTNKISIIRFYIDVKASEIVLEFFIGQATVF